MTTLFDKNNPNLENEIHQTTLYFGFETLGAKDADFLRTYITDIVTTFIKHGLQKAVHILKKNQANLLEIYHRLKRNKQLTQEKSASFICCITFHSDDTKRTHFYVLMLVALVKVIQKMLFSLSDTLSLRARLTLTSHDKKYTWLISQWHDEIISLADVYALFHSIEENIELEQKQKNQLNQFIKAIHYTLNARERRQFFDSLEQIDNLPKQLELFSKLKSLSVEELKAHKKTNVDKDDLAFIESWRPNINQEMVDAVTIDEDDFLSDVVEHYYVFDTRKLDNYRHVDRDKLSIFISEKRAKRRLNFATDVNVLTHSHSKKLTQYISNVLESDSEKKIKQLARIVINALFQSHQPDIDTIVADKLVFELNITQRQDSLAAHMSDAMLNESRQFEIIVPQMVQQGVSYKNTTITQEEINQFINHLKTELDFVYLSKGRIRHVVQDSIHRHGADAHVANIIAGVSSTDETAIYYSGHESQYLQDCFNTALINLGTPSVSKQVKQITRIGSQIAPSYHATQKLLESLSTKIKDAKTDIERYNLYSIYVFFAFSLLTGVRPSFKNLKRTNLDLVNGWFFVIDKPNRQKNYPRCIPLSQIAQKLMTDYLSYIDLFKRAYAPQIDNTSTSALLFQKVALKKNPLTAIVCAVMTEKDIMQHTEDIWGLQKNFGRHVLRNHLSDMRTENSLVNAIFGHEAPFFEGLSIESTLSFNEYKRITNDIDVLALKLCIEPPVISLCHRLEVEAC